MQPKPTKAQYDRERYITLKKPDRFGDRKCRCCTILLRSRHGAHFTRSYCRGCVDSGAAKKDLNRRYYKANRRKILEADQRKRDARLAEARG